MEGLWVVGFCDYCHDVMDDSKVGGNFSLYQWVLNAIGFKLICEALVHSNVGLGVWGLSCTKEVIQEVG